jgi:hypothetical protein
VGGLDEKIEGFFDVCQARGLSGRQGVLIPAANRRHLMLRDDVVDAVRAGRFRVWAIKHVDDGIPLLSGLTAGTPDAEGYSANSFHRAVADHLAGYAEILKSFGTAGANGHRAEATRRTTAEPAGNSS